MVTKLVTLSDLEPRNGRYFALFGHIDTFVKDVCRMWAHVTVIERLRGDYSVYLCLCFTAPAPDCIDSAHWCAQLFPGRCYNEEVHRICCETCSPKRVTEPGALHAGDRFVLCLCVCLTLFRFYLFRASERVSCVRSEP